MSKNFFAAPHAVSSLTDYLDTRTVFARMKTAPDTAVMTEHGQTFGDYFQQGSAHVSSLCGQQDTWSQLQRQQCDGDQAYCWMGCLDLPPGCDATAAICTNMDELPCCTDTVTENCLDMDASCQWKCPAAVLF